MMWVWKAIKSFCLQPRPMLTQVTPPQAIHQILHTSLWGAFTACCQFPLVILKTTGKSMTSSLISPTSRHRLEMTNLLAQDLHCKQWFNISVILSYIKCFLPIFHTYFDCEILIYKEISSEQHLMFNLSLIYLDVMVTHKLGLQMNTIQDMFYFMCMVLLRLVCFIWLRKKSRKFSSPGEYLCFFSALRETHAKNWIWSLSFVRPDS